MKKFIAPLVLLVLTCSLVVFLTIDGSGVRSSFDAEAYLSSRARIDSLEQALWNSRTSPDRQVEIRLQLDSAWEQLSAMRSSPEQSPEEVSTVGGVPLSFDTVKWIIVGVAAIAICVVVLVLILRKRQEIITRRMEAIKAERFKETKAGLDDATIPPRPRREKRSIIADVEAYAAAQQKREAEAAMQSVAPAAAPAASNETPEPKVVFEDENGVPENKILTGAPDSKPTLRPTAKERITSAMQNLSDVLRAPRGLSRERTMKLRAQSRNMTGDPNLQVKSPLEITRFDRESNEKVKILQMSRRGFPASAIASSLKISQEKVEAVIKEAMG
ncbi:hypothetical protein [Fibrobacter sp.]|uniref:hypothetical protein n=1 Tax=Fibrobacter sp. TaxID=35828 RepID=UPI002609830D|nr:hypothetical protein [Fibrobacter sp.]MDD7497273.1 hypothetical protein [Fibrobacter sp.]MDY5725314.1 hypothetical protein [Fibrobacter sp.]